MAKVVQISDDNGVTWYDLPGSTASFNLNSEEIDDTILGQTFRSSEVGLIEWGVESDGIWKGFAGYVADIKGIGTSTATTGETMTLESGKIYAIDTAAREVWDRSVTPVIYDNAVDHTADVEWIDYLFGRVKFLDAYTVTGAVTADINYYPMSTIGKGQTYTLTMQAEAIDTTDFPTAQANSGFKTMIPGLRTVAVELGGVFDANTGAKADLIGRSEVIVEIDPAGDGSSIARGFFKLISNTGGGAVGALEEETLNFSLTVPTNAQEVFNWRHTATTLSNSIQLAIASWLQELNTYEVRYLPSGTAGQSPLDGIDGDVIFTDISLSGGLNVMNVFQVSMSGTGVVTEV